MTNPKEKAQEIVNEFTFTWSNSKEKCLEAIAKALIAERDAAIAELRDSYTPHHDCDCWQRIRALASKGDGE